MCGPADFEALGTCIMRVAALTAAGLGAPVVRQAVRAVGDLARKRPERLEVAMTAGSNCVAVEVGHAERTAR